MIDCTIKPIFTHLWVKGFGWENTIYVADDFTSVKEIDVTVNEETLFIATDENGMEYLLKGHCNDKRDLQHD